MQGKKGPYFSISPKPHCQVVGSRKTLAVLPGMNQSADLSPQKYLCNTNYSTGTTVFLLQFLGLAWQGYDQGEVLQCNLCKLLNPNQN